VRAREVAEAVLQFVEVLDQEVASPGLGPENFQDVGMCGGLYFPSFGCGPEPESRGGAATAFAATRHEPLGEVDGGRRRTKSRLVRGPPDGRKLARGRNCGKPSCGNE
jgi:hypothetical protein